MWSNTPRMECNGAFRLMRISQFMRAAFHYFPQTSCLTQHLNSISPTEVSCPALPPPASGYVLGRAPYRAGDVLQFHCNPEHTLHGRPILVCQDSGRWSDKPPTCEFDRLFYEWFQLVLRVSVISQGVPDVPTYIRRRELVAYGLCVHSLLLLLLDV